MDKTKLMAFLNDFENNEFIRQEEVDKLQKRVQEAIVSFTQKKYETKETDAFMFMDGCALMLQWFQEELLNLKRGYYK